MFSFATNKHVEFHRASAHLCLLCSPEYGSAQWVMGLCFFLFFLNSDITAGLSSALSPPHRVLSHRKQPSCFVACGKRRLNLDCRTRFFSLAAQVGGRTIQRISLSPRRQKGLPVQQQPLQAWHTRSNKEKTMGPFLAAAICSLHQPLCSLAPLLLTSAASHHHHQLPLGDE